MKSQLIRLFVPMFIVVPFMFAHAQWSSDPALNNPIVRAGNNQSAPRIISDGKGGAIICWYDERAAVSSFDIYAQRIDHDGFVRWTVNGVAICTASGSQIEPDIASDGQGGAIIVWTDTRSGDNDIYAQRVDSSGNVLWMADGVAVAQGSTNQANPKIVSDARHGAIVTWNGGTGGFPPTSKIYAQRIDQSGALRWGTQVLVSGTLGFSNAPSIATDGKGGAYIAYAFFPRPDYDVYAQRVDSGGTVLWSSKGVPIATGSTVQDSPMLVADGAGNAFLGYSDYGSGSTPFLYLAILKPSGSIAANFKPVSTSGGQAHHQLSNIGTGLLGITWEDGRQAGKTRTYAQIIDTTGKKSWAADGVEVSNRTGNQVVPFILSDGIDGVIVAWGDQTKSSIETDIYAQRLSGSGAPLWSAAGVPVGTAVKIQQFPWMVSDGKNGAIITWEDYRISLSNSDIYASRLLADGSFPIGPPMLTFSAKTVAFGSVAMGTSSTKTITLSNTGGAPVTIASVTPSDPHFSLTTDVNPIPPSGNSTATVKFEPTAKPALNAYIVIQSNSILSPDTVFVSGTGSGSAAIITDKTSLNFGGVGIGSSKSLGINISNPGNDTLTISSIATNSPKFTVTIASRVLAPGASFDDTVRFSPTASGTVSANLTITSNAPTSPTVVPLTGTGTTEVTMTVDPENVSFGDVAIGSHKDTTLTITNNGNDSLRISSFTSGNPLFTLETPIKAIAPGGVKTFTIRFSPNAAGPLGTTFTVTSNAVSSPNTINVDGIGVADPEISFDPPQLAFGSVDVGSKKDLVLTINNSGSMKLTVTSITSTNSDFSALVGQFEVPGGGSYSDTIRFIPSVAGDRSGTLTITSNAATSPDDVVVEGTGKDVSAVRQVKAYPGAFTLFQNYPNPFQSSTTIRYDLETSAPVRVTVFNTLGQVTSTLVDETQHPGVHTVRWMPAGNVAGTYFYVLRVGSYEAYGTMVLMK